MQKTHFHCPTPCLINLCDGIHVCRILGVSNLVFYTQLLQLSIRAKNYWCNVTSDSAEKAKRFVALSYPVQK